MLNLIAARQLLVVADSELDTDAGTTEISGTASDLNIAIGGMVIVLNLALGMNPALVGLLGAIPRITDAITDSIPNAISSLGSVPPPSYQLTLRSHAFQLNPAQL